MNKSDNNIYTQYENDTLPLNVPFVNIQAMTGALGSYKLSSSNNIEDTENGYVGYISKSGNTLNINAIGTRFSVTVPNNLSTVDYKFIVGWSLVNGRWNMYLSAYDDNHIHTASTTLRKLIDSPAQAETNLNNWKTVWGVPANNIVLAKWYFNAYNDVPKLFILERKISGAAKARDLDFYETTYSSSSNSYNASKTDAYETPASFDGDMVQAVVPDNLFTLDANKILVARL